LSDQIIQARSSGQSSADLENQRDAAVQSLSGLVGIRTLSQPNGGLIVTTTSGTELPTHPNEGQLSTKDATIGPGATITNGGIPGIILGGHDITSQLQGGSLGASITLRDSTLPTFQGELDEFSFSLATKFDAQGLTLFTDPNGNVPPGGGTPVQSTYVGFASEIQVNPAVSADPSLVRDGTHGVTGSATGASAFTVNPAGGPAGFTTLINRVLDFSFGSQVQQGVPQPTGATTGLGVDGKLNAPYAPPATLADNATSLVAAQAAVSATASNQLTTEQTVQTTLTNSLAASSGVNMDAEMSKMIALQNAYGMNARIVTTVQSMFNSLLQAVQ
jgi:flagellar hook-associated protein 1 FlgK